MPALTADRPTRPAVERSARIALWLVLIASWLVMVMTMWDALAGAPPAERIEASGVTLIPTPRTFYAAAIFSAMELGVVLVALWPWRPALYTSRLAVSGLALVTWFVMTGPMSLSRVDRIHRWWLAFMIGVVAVALAGLFIHQTIQRINVEGT